MSRQTTMETRACSIMIERGMEGLRAWISSLPEDDRVLLDGWLVETEQPTEPDEAEPEKELQAKSVIVNQPKMIPEYTCTNCGETWAIATAWCANCGWDGLGG